MERRTLLRGVGAGILALTAGCTSNGGPGGGTDGGSSPTSTPTEQPRPTRTEERASTATKTPTEEPTATASPTASPTPSPQPDQKVTVENYRFVPETFTISTGDTVLWVWKNETDGHNVSPESQPQRASWPGDDERTYNIGHTYAYTFTVPGQYAYHCDPHQHSHDMRGSFTVE